MGVAIVTHCRRGAAADLRQRRAFWWHLPLTLAWAGYLDWFYRCGWHGGRTAARSQWTCAAGCAVPGPGVLGCGSSLLRCWRSVNTHRYVVQQAVAHRPDDEFLFRLDPQLVLYAVEGVPDGHNAVAPGLGDRGVRPAAGE